MANHQNAGNAGLYSAAGGISGMPSAGHYSDMQTLMQNMEILSGWLQQNREDFLSVQDGLEQVERRNVGHSLEALNTRLLLRAVAGEQDSDTVRRLDTQQAYRHCLLSMEKIQDNVCHPCPCALPRGSMTCTVVKQVQ
jgi:hypothetical protein